ncbi:MAG: helix-turn-helix domain-containing protein, partial [Hydrogenophaga sp.]
DMLTLTPGVPWPHCSDVFAVPFETLFDDARNARAARELPLWSGLRLEVWSRLNGDRTHAQTPPQARHASLPLKDVETALIRRAVEDARGNVMQAARSLGISRATVYRKLRQKKPTD